jgi:hypothetical protein
MRGSPLQGLKNSRANRLRLPAQMGIPKSQNRDALRRQKFGTGRVVGLPPGMAVAESIQFNSHSRLLTEKIRNVNANRMLAPEFIATQAPVAQPAPDELLRPSGSFSTRTRGGATGSQHGGSIV